MQGVDIVDRDLARHCRDLERRELESRRDEEIGAEVLSRLEDIIAEVAEDYDVDKPRVRDAFEREYDETKKRPAHKNAWREKS